MTVNLESIALDLTRPFTNAPSASVAGKTLAPGLPAKPTGPAQLKFDGGASSAEVSDSSASPYRAGVKLESPKLESSKGTPSPALLKPSLAGAPT